MADEEEKHFCEKCHRMLNRKQFYVTKNLQKYPKGLLNQCRKCITMHVDNWNPDTYLWILQEIDVPYIPDEWNKIMATYARDKKKMTGASILGRYLAKMKLNQFNKYSWKDTDFLVKMKQNEIEQAMSDRGCDREAIEKAKAECAIGIDTSEISIPKYDEDIGVAPLPEPVEFGSSPAEDEGMDFGLTKEDITYLRLKWGKTYTQEEWITLEQLYTDMTNSYDIQTAGDIETLKLVCKSSLKTNQLLDLGDIDGAQKASKMYDTMMKSGKWTAAQNKTEESELVDSIGELVAICEKDGFIPQYYTDGPKDKVDRVIQDMQQYTRDLVTSELGLGNLIESAIKNIEEEKEAIKEAGEFAESLENSTEEDRMFSYDKPPLADKDYQEFSDMEEALEAEDEELYSRYMNEGGEELYGVS